MARGTEIRGRHDALENLESVIEDQDLPFSTSLNSKNINPNQILFGNAQDTRPRNVGRGVYQRVRKREYLPGKRDDPAKVVDCTQREFRKIVTLYCSCIKKLLAFNTFAIV